jgi:hypothetical protein
MNISGKVYQILPEARGEGKNGPWSRQDFVIETDDQFPKKVCISVWNNKIKLSELKQGDKVDIEISVESREYNGKWYTDVKASGLVSAKRSEPKADDTQTPPWDRGSIPPDPDSEPLGSDDSDLPF